MTDDDATRDGLPRFIYGEYTGETRLPERPEPEADPDPAGADRRTKILIAAGGVALVLIVGLVVAALNTGGAVETPAAANGGSPVAAAVSDTPSPTGSPEPSPSWAMAPTDAGPTANPAGTRAAHTTKPATTRPPTPGDHPTTPWWTITIKPPTHTPSPKHR